MTTTIDFPETGFVDEYEFYMKERPSVTLAIERDVVDPLLIRNSEQDRAETQVIADATRAQSNPEKFTTKERLSGLNLLRRLDNDGDLISEDYAYNEPPALSEAINLDTLTYGMTGTGDQDYGVKSRLVAGYTYTVEEYDVMQAETRNAAFESGTMTNDDGDHLEAGTPAMLAYVLHNVLTTHGYGARETRSGKTVDNDVRAVILAEQPALLSVGEFLAEEDPDVESFDDALDRYIQSRMREDWTVYTASDGFPTWFDDLLSVASREAPDASGTLRKLFVEDTAAAKEGIPKAE
ncbi:type I-D CRISPR-associated protein Cas7/Csc2 [Halobacteriales archaeon QS_4_69_225]|nr:MAG: type I-D CRISPR-associated protein Cas7/Csc2 [Halobacteriales archaeon QS_4_69_225]